MPNIFGGLFLENLFKEDQYFDLQMRLFAMGLIQGVQLRVAHPSTKLGLIVESLPLVLRKLPEEMKVFVHGGAENTGVDFGERLDERGVFAKANKKMGISWSAWNKETLEWVKRVALSALFRIPENGQPCVVHPGYGLSHEDINARDKIVRALKENGDSEIIVLENVPPVVDKSFIGNCGKPETWSSDRFWGFGGTPYDMALLFGMLGKEWKCLIDFTHLQVMVNQANALSCPELNKYKDLEIAVEKYLALPHINVCHFSGIPDGLVDSHDFIHVPIPIPIKDALNQMEAVCLEMVWEEKTAEQQIEAFLNNIK